MYAALFKINPNHDLRGRFSTKASGSKPDFGARETGETDKAYAKRVIDHMDKPKSLPEEHGRYFNLEHAKVLEISNIESGKTDEQNVQGGENGAKRMIAAYHGVLGRRDPITVMPHPTKDGKFVVVDGNGTYTTARQYGWKKLPVQVVTPQEGKKILDASLSKIEILKANPYHDHLGRFATKAGAKFVSIGGVFDVQRAKQPRTYSVEAVQKSIKKLAELGYRPPFDAHGLVKDIASISEEKLDPLELFTALVGKENLGKSAKYLKFTVSPSSKEITAELLEGAVVHGAQVETLIRTLKFKTKDVHHDYLKIVASDRGGGAAKRLFAHSVPLYERLGMKTITTYAGLTGGGYSWSKYGFKPITLLESRNVGYHIDNSITRLDWSGDGSRVSSVEITGTPEAKKELKGLKTFVKKMVDKPDLEHMGLFTNMRTPALDKHFARKLSVDKRMTTIKNLLLNSGWDGILDLKNKKSRNKLETYVGGFK